MELTIQTQWVNEDTVSVSLSGIHIFVDLKDSSNDIEGRAILTAYEAKTLARALLDMAEKLETNPVPKPEPMLSEPDAPEIGWETLSKKITYLGMLAEPKYIEIEGRGTKVFISDKVWETEGRVLSRQHAEEKPCLMNLHRETDGRWWLVDTLPF